jgi:hypothetical protein
MAPILIPLGLGLVALPIVLTSAFARHARNLERCSRMGRTRAATRPTTIAK